MFQEILLPSQGSLMMGQDLSKHSHIKEVTYSRYSLTKLLKCKLKLDSYSSKKFALFAWLKVL